MEVGTNGVAGGHSEVRGQAVELKPADFARFGRLAVRGFARENLAEIGWGDPMLVFARETVIGYAKQGVKGDFDADFFAGFADGALFESFEKIHFAADDAPTTSLRWPLAQGQEHAAVIVGEENADADSGLRRIKHGDLTELRRELVREEWG